MNSPGAPLISVVITCYNEMPHLPGSIKEIEDVLDHAIYPYEIIFVDDCSKDSSRAAVEKICEENPKYRYAFHEKNMGRGRSVRDGLALARGKYAGFIDPDLELPALYIPALISRLEKGYDMACAERIEEWSWNPLSLVRAFVSWGYQVVSKTILPIRTPDSESGLKFFNMDTMRSVIGKTANDRWFWDTEIIADAEAAGKKIAPVRVVLTRKPEKKSTVRLVPDSIAYLRALLQYRRQKTIKARYESA